MVCRASIRPEPSRSLAATASKSFMSISGSSMRGVGSSPTMQAEPAPQLAPGGRAFMASARAAAASNGSSGISGQ